VPGRMTHKSSLKLKRNRRKLVSKDYRLFLRTRDMCQYRRNTKAGNF